jgi:CheY-like chemotaxis protein
MASPLVPGQSPRPAALKAPEAAAAVTKDDLMSILLVEDDKIDAMAVKRAFRELKIGNQVIEAGNGIEALEYLRGENGRPKPAAPCLVLLDLNMPRMGGIEFLDELRRDAILRSTLVFVMTTSNAEEDRMRAYGFNVAGYVLKHRAGQSFLEAIEKLDSYWRLIELPC